MAKNWPRRYSIRCSCGRWLNVWPRSENSVWNSRADFLWHFDISDDTHKIVEKITP